MRMIPRDKAGKMLLSLSFTILVLFLCVSYPLVWNTTLQKCTLTLVSSVFLEF